MSKDLADLPNATAADYAHDVFNRAVAAYEAAQASGAIDRHDTRETVTVPLHRLGDLVKAYRELRLELAAQDINTFEGGDELRGYQKTEAVLRAWGEDVPEPGRRVRQMMDEDA